VAEYAHPIEITTYALNLWWLNHLHFYHVQADILRNRIVVQGRYDQLANRFRECANALTAFGIHRMEQSHRVL
jgi:hypothetical protein